MVCAGASSVTIASIGDAATGAVCTAECGEEFLELELSVEKAITIMSWCSVERRLRNQRGHVLGVCFTFY